MEEVVSSLSLGLYIIVVVNLLKNTDFQVDL